MKKIIIAGATLLAAGCFLIAGCGENAPKQTKNEIHVVTHANWNPFEYMENGKIVGFDVDLAREAVKRAGLTMDLTDAGWEALFEQIRSHQADMAISGVTITKDREASYLFSAPYFLSRQAILVREGGGYPQREGSDGRQRNRRTEWFDGAGSAGKTSWKESSLHQEDTDVYPDADRRAGRCAGRR